jgi:hypothetical protein
VSRNRVSEEQYRELAAAGLVPPLESLPPAGQPAQSPAQSPACKRPKVELLADAFTPPRSDCPLSFVVGVQTACEANEEQWRRRSARSGVIRTAVSRVLGPRLAFLVPFAETYHRGDPVRVHFVRLGGRRLDRLANLGSSLKPVEDAVALMLGADDGAAHWRATCDQEPGGPYGVRIVMSLG